MNLRRGFFRLWIAVAVLWVIAATWILWDHVFDPWAAFPVVLPSDREALNYQRLYAVALIVVPPIALFGFGLVCFWVVRGFRQHDKLK
jgi:hypothetical protein